MSRLEVTRIARLGLAACTAVVAIVVLAACGSTKSSSTSTSGGASTSSGTANPNAQIKKGLKIAFLTNQNTWIKYMKDELSKPQYKNMKLVKVAYGNDDDQKSFQETQGLLSAYPQLKGIISPTTVGIAAAARYIDGSKYKGKVQLTGL